MNFQDGNRLRIIEHEFIFFVLALRGLGGNLALRPPKKQTSKTQTRSNYELRSQRISITRVQQRGQALWGLIVA